MSMLASVLRKEHESLEASWLEALEHANRASSGRISEAELRSQAREFLKLFIDAVSRHGAGPDAAGYPPLRSFLEQISTSRGIQGFSADQTATFVFSFKRPLFDALRAACGKDSEALAREVWQGTELLDQLGLHVMAAFQKTREKIIERQQEDLLELSTPVVKLWDDVLALPMIGTLDSARTQVVMESLLQRIVETGSRLAIIDITGVPTVDTLVAQHLLKTVTAIRLMGAECIISGVRPQIAQTIVHLGVDLSSVVTKATLADALALALKQTGHVITRSVG